MSEGRANELVFVHRTEVRNGVSKSHRTSDPKAGQGKKKVDQDCGPGVGKGSRPNVDSRL